MKKIVKIIMILLMALSCSTLNNRTNVKYSNYELEATIVTSKGDINLFLYPEAAPETVANFVFLAKNKFYDNLVFHRVEPQLVQTGDPNGDGTGGTGYFIKDEFNNFLKFNYAGMVGMANAGDNTTSSQFFITKMPLPLLNGKYNIFGSLKNSDDLIVVKSLEPNDKIEKITISGKNVDSFLSNFNKEINTWEKILKNNENKVR